jgi:hypothetical protein
VNPPKAKKCDCAYDFDARTGGVPLPLWKRYRTVLLFISPIILALLVWALFALNGKLKWIGDPG